MNFKAQFNWLFHESRDLLTDPKKFWKTKLVEGFSTSIFSNFFLPVVLLVGATAILGGLTWNGEILWSFIGMNAVREMVSYILQFFVASAVLFRLLQNFNGTSQAVALNNVLAYSLLPFMLATMIVALFPGLYVLGIIGLYGFYLYTIGTQVCLEIPKDQQARFIILSIVLIILIFGTINVITWYIFKLLFPYGA